MRTEPDWDEKDEDWPDGFPEEPEDDDEPEVSAAAPDGQLRVLTVKCGTCIFRPGNPMHLNPGRVGEMTAAALTRGSYITCHQTLPYGEHPDFGGAVCRGFYDAHGHRSNLIRVMSRLDGITEVPPPAKEDDRA